MKKTQKYSNLKKDPKVSLLVNTGKNSPGDFKDAVSVTVLGEAAQVTRAEREDMTRLHLSKFPYLEDFIKNPSCALIKVKADKYILVTGFQEVRVIEI